MAANTKYTQAPQADPDEEAGSYTQAPPSYQAESSTATDEARLFGGPRSSEDNIPDDFKVCIRPPSLCVNTLGAAAPSPACLRSLAIRRHSMAAFPVSRDDRNR